MEVGWREEGKVVWDERHRLGWNARSGRRQQRHWRGRCRHGDGGRRRGKGVGGGMRQLPLGHFGDGRPVCLAVCGLVQEGGVPTWGEGRSGRTISGLGREEDGGIGAEDLADPEVRVKELAAHQIEAIVGGTGAVCGGQAAQGQRRDPRKEREDRESDRGCQRHE